MQKPTINDFYTYYTETIAVLIAYMEGWYNSGINIPKSHNNPGDLRKWGNYPVVAGYVWFPSPLDGWNALLEQVWLNISRGLTLTEFFRGKEGVYAGYDKTNPEYAQFVSKYSGIPLAGISINDFIQETAKKYS